MHQAHTNAEQRANSTHVAIEDFEKRHAYSKVWAAIVITHTGEDALLAARSTVLMARAAREEAMRQQKEHFQVLF